MTYTQDDGWWNNSTLAAVMIYELHQYKCAEGDFYTFSSVNQSVNSYIYSVNYHSRLMTKVSPATSHKCSPQLSLTQP